MVATVETMPRLYVVYKAGCRGAGVEPLLDHDDFENCLPRDWSHVSDCFYSVVASGFVIAPGSLLDIEPFIAMTHVEHIEVEHVMALACIMRLLERRLGVEAELAYATVYGPLPPIVILGRVNLDADVDTMMRLLEHYVGNGTVVEVDADSHLDAILKALGYRRVESHVA